MVTHRQLVRKRISEIRKEENSKYDQTKEFVQHGNTSVQKHSISVALTSLYLADIFRVKVDRKSMVRGALLHDYFLYDWHEKDDNHKLHGFKHPFIAYKNADRDFKLNEREKDIIVKHMFPLVPVLPACKESWIVTMADKICSTKETMFTVKRYIRAFNRRLFR